MDPTQSYLKRKYSEYYEAESTNIVSSLKFDVTERTVVFKPWEGNPSVIENPTQGDLEAELRNRSPKSVWVSNNRDDGNDFIISIDTDTKQDTTELIQQVCTSLNIDSDSYMHIWTPNKTYIVITHPSIRKTPRSHREPLREYLTRRKQTIESFSDNETDSPGVLLSYSDEIGNKSLTELVQTVSQLNELTISEREEKLQEYDGIGTAKGGKLARLLKEREGTILLGDVGFDTDLKKWAFTVMQNHSWEVNGGTMVKGYRTFPLPGSITEDGEEVKLQTNDTNENTNRIDTVLKGETVRINVNEPEQLQGTTITEGETEIDASAAIRLLAQEKATKVPKL